MAAVTFDLKEGTVAFNVLRPPYEDRGNGRKKIDMYPELSLPENNVNGLARLPAYRLWVYRKMQPLDSGWCAGYSPAVGSLSREKCAFRYEGKKTGRHMGLDISCLHANRPSRDHLTLPLSFTVTHISKWDGKKVGYGNRVEVLLDNSGIIGDKPYIFFMFSHLERVDVEVGKSYAAETVIGREGTSGAAAEHLHIECADMTNASEPMQYQLYNKALPNARDLFAQGLLRSPWYYIDFNAHTGPDK